MGKVVVVGLGYVGLPLACLCAERGMDVSGFDVDAEKASLINAGKSPIRDEALENKLKKLKGKIKASPDEKILEGADMVVICVPTPAENGKPDLRFVEESGKSVSRHLHRGELVIMESTVYPGTTDEIVKPLLEESGLKAGKDFYLAYCPERIDPGNKKWVLENIPRVLSASSKEGIEKALAFYKQIIKADILVLSSIKAAEAVKIVENTFRDINIAFVNELAMSFDKMGIDISEVIRGASTKPFGYMPFYPGPGVGGHCIAQDPYYLIEKAERSGFSHRFLKLAREINNLMPNYVVELTESILEKQGKNFGNAKVALLGVAYKANVDDMRESPSLKIMALLGEKGTNLKIFDPYIPAQSNVKSIAEAIGGADCVIVAVNHRDFAGALSAEKLRAAGVKAILDCRNCLDKEKISAAGIIFKGIGR